MRLSKLAATSCAALLLGSAALLPAQTTVEKVATKPKPKLVCHDEVVTGSLAARKKTCLTAEQWKDMANRTRDEMSVYGAGRFSCAGGNTPNC
jgi:hypothetical protein